LQQHCKHNLTAFRKYKPFIAATLLALYAFVATPVQWWHHHNTTAANSKQAVVAKATSSGSDSGCQICSHKYAAYYDDALIPFVSSILIPTAKNDYYRLLLIVTPSYSLLNKGPPALS
jgi:hypothetical protein